MKSGIVNFIGRVTEIQDDISTIQINEEFSSGLLGIENFSHLIILYWFHERDNLEHRSTLQVYPKRHQVETLTGVFACRSPSRPNPIGYTPVELLCVEKQYLRIRGLDAHLNSPIIDVKPYHPRSDSIPDAETPRWTGKGPKT